MAKPDVADPSGSPRPREQSAPEATVMSVFKMTKGCVMLKVKRHVSGFTHYEINNLYPVIIFKSCSWFCDVVFDIEIIHYVTNQGPVVIRVSICSGPVSFFNMRKL